MTKKQECLDFIRYVLNPGEEVQKDWSALDWEELFRFASEQALLGVVFEGVKRLGEQGVKPPFQLLMKWVAIVEQIERRNRKVNKVAMKVTECFREEGFRSCVLKGQGNTLYYPHPYVRMSGDIDIWLEGGRERIMQFVDSRWRGLTMRYHHVEIPDVDGVPVEVHFTPSFMNAPWLNRKWQDWFKKQSDEQFSHVVELPDEVGRVCVPTLAFNLIYQMNHIYRHLFSEGIGLRQIVDYYYLLRGVERAKLKMDSFESSLKELGMKKFAGALMWVLKEVLGLEENMMLVQPNEKEGRFLLDEIMIGGNFGQYDTRLGTKEDESVPHRYLRMTLRNLRIATHYPDEALCEPLFRTWFFFWRACKTSC